MFGRTRQPFPLPPQAGAIQSPGYPRQLAMRTRSHSAPLRAGLRALLLLVAILPLRAHAQKASEPRRPKLAASADTNDWEAYYDYGVAMLRRSQKDADAAFHWASRIDPTKADPYFGRWVAFWIKNDRFARYMDSDAKVLAMPDVRRADSYRTLALHRNPFVHQGLFLLIIDAMPGYYRADEVTRGWIAYARADLPRALDLFGRVVARNPEKWSHLRYLRAAGFVGTGAFAQATTELEAYLASLRASDRKQTVDMYESKALLEYGLGLLYQQQGRVQDAREAYGRALVEDLAFVPVHVAAGRLALDRTQYETAERSFALALEADSTDLVARLGMGDVLLVQNRHADAVEHYRRAWLAAPHYADAAWKLGFALEKAGENAQAVAAYERALAAASRRWPHAQAVRTRLATLAPPVTGR